MKEHKTRLGSRTRHAFYRKEKSSIIKGTHLNNVQKEVRANDVTNLCFKDGSCRMMDELHVQFFPFMEEDFVFGSSGVHK